MLPSASIQAGVLNTVLYYYIKIGRVKRQVSYFKFLLMLMLLLASLQAHKYHDLVKVEAEEPPVHAERLVRKQLRPGWQKLRAAQPCIDIAWAVNTRKALSIGTGQMTPRFEISAVGVAEAALRAL